MKKIGTSLLLCFMALAPWRVPAQDTVRLTLDSCLRYAYGHNLQVRTAALGHESAEADLTGAKLRFLPTVGASASQGFSWSGQATGSTSVGINGSLTLFDGLSTVRSYRQSKLGAEQSELQVRQTENSVGLQVVSAYLTILMNEEKLSYQREVIETSHQQELEGELKFQVGRLLESDYQLLKANHLSAQSEIENTLLTIEENRNALKTLLGLDSRAVLEVVPSDDSLRASDREVQPLDSLMARARRHMPDWQISQLDVDQARLAVGLARSAFLPTVSLNAGVAYNDGTVFGSAATDNPAATVSGGANGSLTLGVSIPLLNRGTSLTQLKQSKISLQQAELKHHQALLDLEDELETCYLNSRQALNRFRSTEALAEAYHASYEVYVLKYGEGAVTTVEMLQQQDKYLSALNEYLQSKYSYLLSEKQLDIYTGKAIKL